VATRDVRFRAKGELASTAGMKARSSHMFSNELRFRALDCGRHQYQEIGGFELKIKEA